ncbi:class I poly(R)-hydroxyalkanoic acid synthase [Pandoraea commovens]|uniref:Poly-beta-hydroxybutyrate polymerase n=2 Tax=Pandoraea commovens TaxID=2508289 RepID=A0A5E4SE94_9BURK|nr:poly-beta-hydroxybutyrate polymerase [Pandoraea commovens]
MNRASANFDPASFAASFAQQFPSASLSAQDMSQWFKAAQQLFGALPGSAGPSPFAANGAAAAANPFAGLFELFGKSGAMPQPTSLHVDPARLNELQSEYAREFAELVAGFNQPGLDTAPALGDRRFAGEGWRNPFYALPAALYLLNGRFLMRMADLVDADAKTRERIRFAVEQWVAASSPANFIATNPDAQQRLVQTHGDSLLAGMQHLLVDMGKGKVSQTDEAAFEVGRNVATTEGAVVFENDLIQLIQYKALTPTVHQRPLLIVPPCINKFYILDLQPENSLVRYAVEQGHTVFVVSWRNPDASLAHKTWDDYVGEGPIAAIDVVRDISGQSQINALGFCVGGTLLAAALAVLAAKGQTGRKSPVASVTLLTTLLDFSDTGVLDVFVDEPHVQFREQTIGGGLGQPPGLMRGVELANTFSFLRPNDLVWNYVVDSYLKGNAPQPFDLLYWNGDGTNLPGPMFCWYLRHLYLQNELKQPGVIQTCGVPVDLGAIEAPAYVFGSREDHIVPWTSAFRSLPLLGGERRFVLGASGHIAGVVNPPVKKKRSYWRNDDVGVDASDWLAGATEHPGSWWTDWSDWLAGYAGKRVKAQNAYGNVAYAPIEPAPGRYVKAKA